MNCKQGLKQAQVEALSHDGRGIVRLDGKTVFLKNALPGEEVSFDYINKHRKFDEGIVREILKTSPDRVTPKCPHFNICGGCSLQHLDSRKQLFFKTTILKEQLLHFGFIDSVDILPPIVGPIWGYRSRARLSVKYVHKKQKVLVGFHENNGRYVVEMESCEILHPVVGKKIAKLSELIASLSIYNKIPQIEIACSDETTILLLRNLNDFSDKDIILLRKFSEENNFHFYSQAGGVETIRPFILSKPSAKLSYKLFEQNVEMYFEPTDFTQINQAINKQMVNLVIELLELQMNEKILDLFCGIGNFTIPIAKVCSKVVGVEGNHNAIIRAKRNAEYNNIDNAEFFCADLTKEQHFLWANRHYDKVLLDPPRSGAQEICINIKKFGAKKVIYISCNQATFARDAKELIDNGYKLQNIRIIDMFPHTSHMETVAVFVRI